VDEAVLEHIQTLKDIQDTKIKDKDSIEHVSPELFTKTWEEGGLLSKAHVRQVQANPQVDPNVLLG
jgi:hypothetical protein